MKKYYKLEFPHKATKIGETPLMNEKNIFPQILESHMTPKGKWGKVVVIEGEIQYKWEDDSQIYTVDTNNPLIIEPERLHKLVISGPVILKVEFYKLDEVDSEHYDKSAKRPGENFI